MKRLLLMMLAVASCCGPKDGEYVFRVLTTNDVHGCYFDSLYVGGGVHRSLMSAAWQVDSVRSAAGEENVILIDVGDFLQGDNAAYYYNYVDTVSAHLYARMSEYMGYDAVVVGNHDIETGHPVYDRLKEQMTVPLLAANALRTDDGKAYFQEYVILRRHGLRIAVIGFTNPGIPGWLSPELWSGMEFADPVTYVQEVVDRVRADEKPDVVIAAIHSGAGRGNPGNSENSGMYLFRNLEGVDMLLCAHDHRPAVHSADSISFVNSGSHCRYVGQGLLKVRVENGRVTDKSSEASLIPVNPQKNDTLMRELFSSDYEAVKAFTLREVGQLKAPLRTIDAYRGMSDYINLLHTLSLSCEPARISFAAPLTYDGEIPAGKLVYNDLFTIYPYENRLVVVSMTGKEIRDYLEYSYNNWINTYNGGAGHLLKIRNASDLRTGQKGWSFAGRSYNFDSAGGLVYEVDVRKPFGERVRILSLADGTAFCESDTYNVAMTSYRANGGGGIMREGAGIDTRRIDERTVARYPEIREMLYDYIKTNGEIDSRVISDPSVIGKWEFVPAALADKALTEELELLFGDYRM